MKKYLVLIMTALILLPCIAVGQENSTDSSVSGVGVQAQDTAAEPAESGAEAQQNTLEILKSIVRSKTTLQQRMDEKKKAMEKAGSETEKQYLTAELAELDKQMADAATDFEMTATGVEIGLFVTKKKERFDWKEELLSLAEPGIMELKRLTVKARRKSKLNDELTNYQELLPVAVNARTPHRIADRSDPRQCLGIRT